MNRPENLSLRDKIEWIIKELRKLRGNVDNTSDLNNKQDKLQNVTGNIGVGKTDASATEKLDVNGNVKANAFIKSGGTSTQILMANGSVVEKSDFYQVNKGGVSTQDSLVANGNQVLSTANTLTNFDGDLSNITFEGTFANFNGYLNSHKTLGFTLAAPTSSRQGIYYKTWYSASTPWRRLWDTSNFSQSNINNWNTAHGWGNHATAGYALANGTVNYVPKFTASGKIGNSLIFDNGTNVGIGTTSPSEKLEVIGNVKATQIKDQYGTLRSQRVITITGNITLSQIHNGAILHITNTCNITIPTGLGADFACDCYVKGAFIATFVNGGVTLNSPSGLRLKTDKMCTLYSNSANSLNLLGELATS